MACFAICNGILYAVYGSIQLKYIWSKTQRYGFEFQGVLTKDVLGEYSRLGEGKFLKAAC